MLLLLLQLPSSASTTAAAWRPCLGCGLGLTRAASATYVRRSIHLIFFAQAKSCSGHFVEFCGSTIIIFVIYFNGRKNKNGNAHKFILCRLLFLLFLLLLYAHVVGSVVVIFVAVPSFIVLKQTMSSTTTSPTSSTHSALCVAPFSLSSFIHSFIPALIHSVTHAKVLNQITL